MSTGLAYSVEGRMAEGSDMNDDPDDFWSGFTFITRWVPDISNWPVHKSLTGLLAIVLALVAAGYCVQRVL
jgi:hypothetical protein